MSRCVRERGTHRLFSCCFVLLLLRSSLAGNQQGGGSSPVHSGRVVKTKYGNLRGMTIQSSLPSPGSTYRKGSAGNVEAFLGVPYAAPPIGSLRYLPPASPGPWPGIRPAVHLSPACPQQFPHLANRTASLESMPRARYYQLKRMQLLLANQSEDCLYLNIYAPSEGLQSGGGGGGPMSSSAVIVLIHGESYSWGAGHLLDGGLLATKSRMIVVTLNYRLGILGFLQTAASPTPGQARGKSRNAIATQGNYGLLDIMAALLWIKDNIGGFGGDSSRITLSGHGTGAALVNLLMISPLASGLFQRAVLMSGSALSPSALNHQAGWLKSEVARQMDCVMAVPDALADIGDCLRKRPLESLLAIRLPATPRFCPTFAPFVDGAGIVAVDPLQAMQSSSQDFARIPLVAGVTSVESYRHIGDADLRNGITEERRDRTLRTLVRNFYQYHLNEIFYVLKNEYTDWDRPSALDPLSMRDSLASALSDALVVAPLMHVVHLHAQRSANPSGTYFYHYQGPYAPIAPIVPSGVGSVVDPFAQTPTDSVVATIDSSEYHRLGSVTGDELEALQLDATANGQPGWSSSGDGHDETGQSNATGTGNTGPAGGYDWTYLAFLTAFASTGDPNLEIGSKGELIPRKVRWEPFNLHSQFYTALGGGTGEQQLKSHYRGHHIAVWLQLIPQLHQPGGATNVNATHHQFDQDEQPSEQFYDGVIRPVGAATSNGRSPDSCSSSGNNASHANNASTSGLAEWNVVNPNVMASETGAPVTVGTNNGSSSGVVVGVNATATIGNRLNMFWTNQAALSITLVLGTFFLVVNLVLVSTIYRRHRCRKRRDANRPDDSHKDAHQRMSDGQLDGRLAPQSLESMTDLRQLVGANHCQQHPQRCSTSLIHHHHQPVLANNSCVSDLASRAVDLTDSLPAPPAFLLRAPPLHHQLVLGDESRTLTLPGNRKSSSISTTSQSGHHQASMQSTREITV